MYLFCIFVVALVFRSILSTSCLCLGPFLMPPHPLRFRCRARPAPAGYLVCSARAVMSLAVLVVVTAAGNGYWRARMTWAWRRCLNTTRAIAIRASTSTTNIIFHYSLLSFCPLHRACGPDTTVISNLVIPVDRARCSALFRLIEVFHSTVHGSLLFLNQSLQLSTREAAHYHEVSPSHIAHRTSHSLIHELECHGRKCRMAGYFAVVSEL